MVIVPLAKAAKNGIVVGHVPRVVSGGSLIRPQPIKVLYPGIKVTGGFSPRPIQGGGDVACTWSASQFLVAHRKVVSSGVYNFMGCRIPIPTPIRYDRIRSALGNNISAKEQRVLELLQFGMPLDCNGSYGVSTRQKKHHSAVSFPDAISEYFAKGKEMGAIIGPFKESPITNLCFSPLMSVPKDINKRRVIVDFSFPAGRSINEGISKTTYLDHKVEFSLPSVQSMVSRVNFLGKGCLLYKRDLKHAFRQFSIDPGDYKFTGMSWHDNIYFDTRLAMGLRSSAYCCQSVTELVAKIAGVKAHVLVYLDDFGGAELPGRAVAAFEHLGWLLHHFGLEEAPEKAVAPSTCMDWLGIRFDTAAWTMALKPSKLQELLIFLPKLLSSKRVKKVLLQKVLGSLVWASAVVRSGAIFFNRLLALLRKLKRPNHSIYFSHEAKVDVSW